MSQVLGRAFYMGFLIYCTHQSLRSSCAILNLPAEAT